MGRVGRRAGGACAPESWRARTTLDPPPLPFPPTLARASGLVHPPALVSSLPPSLACAVRSFPYAPSPALVVRPPPRRSPLTPRPSRQRVLTSYLRPPLGLASKLLNVSFVILVPCACRTSPPPPSWSEFLLLPFCSCLVRRASFPFVPTLVSAPWLSSVRSYLRVTPNPVLLLLPWSYSPIPTPPFPRPPGRTRPSLPRPLKTSRPGSALLGKRRETRGDVGSAGPRTRRDGRTGPGRPRGPKA